jgi:hypothetical protein
MTELEESALLALMKQLQKDGLSYRFGKDGDLFTGAVWKKGTFRNGGADSKLNEYDAMIQALADYENWTL